MTTQFVTNRKGRKVAVIVPLREYKKMLDELDELEDIRLYDEAKKDKSESMPIEKAFQQLDAKRKKK